MAPLDRETARAWTPAKSSYSSIASDSPASRRCEGSTRTPRKSVAMPKAEAFGYSRGPSAKYSPRQNTGTSATFARRAKLFSASRRCIAATGADANMLIVPPPGLAADYCCRVTHLSKRPPADHTIRFVYSRRIEWRHRRAAAMLRYKVIED
jgi:hypothetical protein